MPVMEPQPLYKLRSPPCSRCARLLLDDRTKVCRDRSSSDHKSSCVNCHIKGTYCTPLRIIAARDAAVVLQQAAMKSQEDWLVAVAAAEAHLRPKLKRKATSDLSSELNHVDNAKGEGNQGGLMGSPDGGEIRHGTGMSKQAAQNNASGSMSVNVEIEEDHDDDQIVSTLKRASDDQLYAELQRRALSTATSGQLLKELSSRHA